MFKQGYCIFVKTWENDYDNLNTVKVDGLNRDEVEFYLKVCGQFKSNGSGRASSGNYGNMESTPNEEIDSIISSALSMGKGVPHDWLEIYNSRRSEEFELANANKVPYPSEYGDYLYDIIGTSEGGYWRVFESAEIYNFDQPKAPVTYQFTSL